MKRKEKQVTQVQPLHRIQAVNFKLESCKGLHWCIYF